jgi:transcriptional regulator with XRE-family HTH domain
MYKTSHPMTTTPSNVNLQKLAALLRTKRGDRGLREVASEIGNVSASTLSRIEQGNVPDLETFIQVCKWLKVSPDDFVAGERTKSAGNMRLGTELEIPEAIEAHLRADRTLPPATINALSEMIRVAYRAAHEGKLRKT